MSADLGAVDAVRPVAPEPEFTILRAAPRRHTALPTLEFELEVVEPSGRAVHLIALTAQIMIEPARRAYDAASRERLVELFGPPERWATTTRSLMWHRADVVVAAFTGATTFTVAVPCTFDLEVAAARYFHAVERGLVPLAFNFNGTIHYLDDDDRRQIALVPWSCSAGFDFPVDAWHAAIADHYPHARWVALHEDTLAQLLADKARRGVPTIDAAVAALLAEARR